MNADNRKKMPCRSTLQQLLLLAVAGMVLTTVGCDEGPELPAQPQIPGECYATYQGEGRDSNGEFTLYGCTQTYMFLKDADGNVLWEFLPYTRETKYFCYKDGALKDLCQKEQTISDPLGKTPGNQDFSYNELNTVRNQLIQKYFSATESKPVLNPNDYLPDPFDDVSDEDGLHPTFLRLLANDPKIKYRRREFAGGFDPFLNGHLFCNHNHPYATPNADGTFTNPTSNYSDREAEGQYFSTTDDQLTSTLLEVARKVRLRLVDVDTAAD